MFLFVHSVVNVIIPADFHMFQRGGSTTNQKWLFKKQNGKPKIMGFNQQWVLKVY